MIKNIRFVLSRWTIFFLLILPLFFTNCSSFDVSKITYNQRKNYFEYKQNNNYSIPLRDDNLNLIDSTNIDVFKAELLIRKNNYPFKERDEMNELIFPSDLLLAKMYSAMQKAMKNEDYATVLSELHVLRFTYFDIDYFSDCLFLEANAYEHIGKIDTAKFIYQKFLKQSSKKFSCRMHGYSTFDANDSDFITERNYAMAFCNRIHIPLELKKTEPIIPKYYFGSYQPGYLYNEEDKPENKKFSDNIFLSLDRDLYNNLAISSHLVLQTKKIAVDGFVSMSKNVSTEGIAVPVQIYKSTNNRLGLKLSPFFTFNEIKYITSVDTSFINVPNLGVKLSCGFYVMPNISIGAYYLYNLYNKKATFTDSKTNLTLWWNNEYDVSLYYNLMRNISLKTGVKNNDFVLGLFCSGIEFSWSFLNRGFILRTSLL